MRCRELKQIRTRLGLSQPKLAALLGVHHMSVSAWENGDPIPGPVELAMHLLGEAPEDRVIALIARRLERKRRRRRKRQK